MSDSITAAGQSGYVQPGQDATKTDRGTKIVKNTDSLDKNAFLKILCAELANQNPENATDGTQYIAQMAQFSSLEQMSNLNTGMEFNNASSLVGKAVTMNVNNEKGDPYMGIVTAVTKSGSNIKITLKYGVNDSDTKDFNYSDIAGVFYVPTSTSTSESK